MTEAENFVLTVARAQLGDRSALDEVLRSLQEPLFAHLSSIVGDQQTAEDVLQETLMIVARKLRTLRDPRWLRAWAYRIATRQGVRRATSELRWRDAPSHEEIAEGAAEPPAALDPESIERLSSALSQVSPASQIVLRMHYLEEMSCGEIAEALDLSVGTVKSRLAYGLRILRGMLTPSDFAQ